MSIQLRAHSRIYLDLNHDSEIAPSWLNALTEAGSYEGKLYAVPYYAGARAIMYDHQCSKHKESLS